MKTEDAKELIVQQIQSLSEALDSGKSDQLESFLSTMARFHKYSLGNMLLIMAQHNPMQPTSLDSTLGSI